MGRSNTVSALTRTPPMWAAEFLSPDKLMPAGGKLLLSAFRRPDAVLVKLNGAGQNAGATSLTVDALVAPAGWDGSSTLIPNGTILDFGAAQLAVVNDSSILPTNTSITVRAIPANIADDAEAWYAGTQVFSIPSGTVVGRTFAERATNDRFGPAAAADDEVFLTAFDITDINEMDGDVEFVKPFTVVKENYLPGWSGLAAAVKALVRATYHTQLGVA